MKLNDVFKSNNNNKNNSVNIFFNNKKSNDVNIFFKKDKTKDYDFCMKIDGVFTIVGQGVSVTGAVEKGRVAVNDIVRVLRQDGTEIVATVAKIEVAKQMMDEIGFCSNAEIMLKGIQKTDISKGDIIYK